MIFLGRGLKNHLVPATAASARRTKRPAREQFCHLAPREACTCSFAVIMGQDNQEGSGIHGADLYR